jgi:ABC-type phosphate transport system permease subunit
LASLVTDRKAFVNVMSGGAHRDHGTVTYPPGALAASIPVAIMVIPMAIMFMREKAMKGRTAINLC